MLCQLRRLASRLFQRADGVFFGNGRVAAYFAHAILCFFLRLRFLSAEVTRLEKFGCESEIDRYPVGHSSRTPTRCRAWRPDVPREIARCDFLIAFLLGRYVLHWCFRCDSQDRASLRGCT